MVEHIVFILFASVSGVLVLFYFLVHLRVILNKEPEENGFTPPVSVIVAARNEVENLRANLPSLLTQKYPNYEVVVVDDGSWDGTGEFVETLQSKHRNIKLVSLNIDERFHRGKKFALTMGMKGAKHNHFIFTDADCTPSSNQWLKWMASGLLDRELVIGHSPVVKGKGLTGWLSSINHTLTGIHFLGFALAKKPYMGVGRNLGYTKELFFKGKGFSEHIKLLSGDDDLFVNQHATAGNTTVILTKMAYTWTTPPESFQAFVRQKKRHHSTVRYYKLKDQFHLTVFHTSQILFYYLLTILIGLNFHLLVVLIIAGSKTLIQWVLDGIAASKLGDKRTGWLMPFADLSFVLQSILMIPSLFKLQKSWN